MRSQEIQKHAPLAEQIDVNCAESHGKLDELMATIAQLQAMRSMCARSSYLGVRASFV